MNEVTVVGDNNIINNAAGDINQAVFTSTEENSLNAVITAQIILDFLNVREKYRDAEWSSRGDVLTTLHKYSTQTNFLLAKELFSFLSDITEHNRGCLPKNIALSIWCLITDFFPHCKGDNKAEQTIQLLDLCCEIGFNIAYDNAIYSGDFTTVMYGLLILKYAYFKGKGNNNHAIIDRINDKYNELEKLLADPYDKKYLELISCFRKDLSENGLQFPKLPDNLTTIIYTKQPLNL